MKKFINYIIVISFIISILHSMCGREKPDDLSIKLEDIRNYLYENNFKKALEKLHLLDGKNNAEVIFLKGMTHFKMAEFYNNLYRASLDDLYEYLNNEKDNLKNSSIGLFSLGLSFYERENFNKSLLYLKALLSKSDTPDILKYISNVFISSIYLKTGNKVNYEKSRIMYKDIIDNNIIIKNFQNRLLCSILDKPKNMEIEIFLDSPKNFIYDGLVNVNYLNIATIYMYKGYYKKALNYINQYDESFPFWKEKYLYDKNLGKVIYKRYYSPFYYKILSMLHYSLAQNQFETIKNDFSSSKIFLNSLYYLGMSYFKNDKYDKALNVWETLIEKSKDKVINDVLLTVSVTLTKERIKFCKYILNKEEKEFDYDDIKKGDIMSIAKKIEFFSSLFEYGIKNENIKEFFSDAYEFVIDINEDNLNIEEYEYYFYSCLNIGKYFLDLEINDKERARIILRKIYNEGSSFTTEGNDIIVLIWLSRASFYNLNTRSESLKITYNILESYPETYIHYEIKAHLFESIQKVNIQGVQSTN